MSRRLRHTLFFMTALGLSASSGGCDRSGGPGGNASIPGRASSADAPGRGGVEVEPIANDKVVAGQTIYVPAYSHIFTANDAHPFNLAVTLSIRNTDRQHPIVISSVRYYNQEGHSVRDYLKKPLRIAPLASVDYFVKEGDTSGGSSASFLVDWAAENAVSDPVVEAVMIGIASTQGISFTCPGRVVSTRAPR